MPVRFDGEPVVFVPSAARLVDQALPDPLDIAAHERLLAARYARLDELARSIDDRLVAGENFVILDGIEVMLMSRASAQRGVERGLGTILDARFSRVANKQGMALLRRRPGQTPWHYGGIGLDPDEAINAGAGIVVGIADSWWCSHDGIDYRKELSRSAFDSSGNATEATEVPGSHGTAMVSLIVGDVGVAQSADFVFASVLRDCSLGGCSGSPAAVAAGLDWLVRTVFKTGQRVRVINASFDVAQTAELERIVMSAWRSQVLIVGASGNHGGDQIACPATVANVVAVGALRKNDTPWSLTPVSGIKPDVWAPGSAVLAATRLNGYALVTGTSAAAAIVTGGAAKIVGETPAMTVSELRDALIARTRAVDAGARPKRKLWFG